MNPVVHFEMPYDDAQRAAEFYENAFGWKPTLLGQDMNNYVTVDTTETKNGRPVTPGAINGGLWQKDLSKPAQVTSLVIAVDDIKEAISKVTQAGGEVLGDPYDIPEVGTYVSFMDTEGNRQSMLQPATRNQNA